MTTALRLAEQHPTAKRWLSFVLLVALGLLGNYAHFPIFLNIDFLFGSIFAMLALQLLGLRLGVLAAALIGSYTLVLWNHPYATLIVTGEALFVGLLYQRRQVGLVLADALYWVLVGMPATYVLYGLVMDVPMGNIQLVVVKQSINGIANALVARLLFSAYLLNRRTALVGLRDMSYNLLAFFALCPALVLLAIASHHDVAEADRHLRSELVQDDLRLRALLEHWLQERTDSVVQLSRMAASLPSSQMQGPLDQARLSDDNFLRAGLLDSRGTVLQYSPLVDERGVSTVGQSFADRPYYESIQTAQGPMLSEVVMGRMGPPSPIVTLLAPVRRNGVFTGYISGVLSLEHLRTYLERSLGKTNQRYLVLDKNGAVILGNRPEQKTMAIFHRPEGVRTAYSDGSFRWTPLLVNGRPTMEQWQHSWYVTESCVGSLGEWRLVLEQPVEPIQKALATRYTRLLGTLLLTLLAALLLAEWISRRTLATLGQLNELTYQLPAKLAQHSVQVEWPRSGIAETRALIRNFKVMAASLSDLLTRERQINERLDAQVAERTAALSHSLLEKDALLREVHHRVKNNLQVITSMLRLESGRSEHPASRSVLQDMQDRVRSMALLHETIYRVGTFSAIDLGDYLRQVATQALRALQSGTEGIQLRLDLGHLMAGLDQATPCGLLVNELLSNSFKHGFPAGQGGEVWVSLQPINEDYQWRLQVRDSGVGLPPDFAARRQSGLGLKLVEGLADQIGGRLEVGPGATFTVVFRCAPAALAT
ncbi:hypothetical protein DIC66_07310 [Rhodoferax lacus]|uniref:histidine kinase n=1 Tax=Rhodoferax lacus TaxID=2184758 RepID=A0A3E1RE61_9BURK|nr:sensor histidine kinase [Rhodoferax lacus]RFO97658.1 hypothetical protein DIC66_07310 [Rhodoferax lacus]